MRTKLACGVALAALMLPGAAYAQSTGTIDFEQGDIVVNGTRDSDVAGTKIPDSPKAKVELTGEFLAHETAGQTVLETINMLPGVSFTNNDAYGSSGGTLTIRGFDASRISLTIDGVPLNDTGNYAIYSNQQLDPELIDQVNVVLGSTDIDSPSASASGSTVNYTSVTPTDQFGVRLAGSVGDLNMMRVFGMVNTGVFTPWGTKAWFAASTQEYDLAYQNTGKIKKQQYNFKVYQPIGSNGDFIAIAGNYNENRNNNTNDYTISNYPSKANRYRTVAACQTDTAQAGVADTPTSCGTDYTASYNPSNTGTLRITSKFHLANNLILTVDPTFWYTKANGGSSAVSVCEGTGTGGYTGYVAGSSTTTCGSSVYYYAGKDLNGDGDTLDTVKLYAPSQTTTHRYLVTSSLLWTASPDQSFRLSYTHDYGRHRQTGEFAYLNADGSTSEYFPIDDAITAADGSVLEKRNRKSYAILDAVAGQYRGKFFDERLTLDIGVSGKFFKRNLNQYCFTTSATGGVYCPTGDAATIAAYAAAHPTYAVPQSREFSYSRALPSAGLTYKLDSAFTLYGSYSQGIQVPGTDNLYASFYYAEGVVSPKPEISHNFDAGIRYTTGKIQAQVGPWYTIFDNRLASSYDEETQTTTYRNLGTVHRYGVDGSIAYQPVRELSLYAFGSYLKSKILHDVASGTNSYYATAGQRESGMPVYTLGGRAQVNVEPIQFGAEVKRTGRSYFNDQNVDLVYSGVDYGKYAPGYTVVNLDARVGLERFGLNKQTYLQFNVTNLFDTYYITHFSSSSASTNNPYVYLSAPRTFSATLNVQF